MTIEDKIRWLYSKKRKDLTIIDINYIREPDHGFEGYQVTSIIKGDKYRKDIRTFQPHSYEYLHKEYRKEQLNKLLS